MKITLAGVFAGVFVGALGYELIQRTKPEVVDKIRGRVSEMVDTFSGNCDLEDEIEFDDVAEGCEAKA